ncbi:MAG: type I-U CRISPR-associated protein Csx17, partial [Polyangiaceae bacterium]
DPDVLGHWRGEEFHLVSSLDERQLVEFFLQRYSPSPLVAPWNGGSGFFSGDNRKAREKIEGAESARYLSYRETLRAADAVLERLKIAEKPTPEQKQRLLEACRAWLPDVALRWLDSAFVITSDGAKYPPLLGTGGNDGRLEFSNNFMQRLVGLIEPKTGQPTKTSEELLRSALFGETTSALEATAVGQFLPGNAGGVNSTTGYSGGATVNSWDFVLMLEGALLFAAASVRRLDDVSDGSFAYPFTVRGSGVGYGSASSADEGAARGELWAPLWESPASLGELRSLFSEGKARVRGRTARNGLDFAEAIATLGVDRGIAAFQRYGFQQRNGLSYFATPLNRCVVERRPHVDLLAPLEAWLERVRRSARGDNAPARVSRTVRRLDSAIFDLCLRDDAVRVTRVFRALGTVERALSESLKWTTEQRIRPMPWLKEPRAWLEAMGPQSPEQRLALSLASTQFWLPEGAVPLRAHLEPVAVRKKSVTWSDGATPDVVWHPGSLERLLLAIFHRRLLLAQRARAQGEHYSDGATRFAKLSDVNAFISGTLDHLELTEFLWAYSLFEPAEVGRGQPTPDEAFPGAFYALLKCCFPGVASVPRAQLPPLTPAILVRAAAGDSLRASKLASGRLLASGARVGFREVLETPARSRRTAAATIFPVAAHAIAELRRRILREDADDTEQEQASP